MQAGFGKKDKYTVDDLVEIMSLLRSENGCPWDREQTHASIRKNFIEETYEAVEAIDEDNPDKLKEELGVSVKEEELKDCGMHRMDVNTEFYGKPFIDRQVSKVYLLHLDWEAEDFKVQEEEIESVIWMDFEECMQAVIHQSIPNCIDIKELEMLKAFL